jgi:hypothetical protein
MASDWISNASALVVNSSLRAAIVAASIGIVLIASRVRSSGARHAVWTAVLAVMMFMPVLLFLVPPVVVQMPAPVSDLGAVAFADDVTTIRGLDLHGPTTGFLSSGSHGGGVARTPLWLESLLALYLVGAAVSATRLWWGRRCARQLEHASVVTDVSIVGATGRTTPVVESAMVSSPLTVGVIAPVIVLPSGWRAWPEDFRRAVLAHEMAHIRRRDPLVSFLAHLNRCVFWFHPLAWWLERKLAATAEDACDDAGVREIGTPRRYAEVLIEIADTIRRRGRRVSFQGVGVDGSGLLSQRIDRVLSGDLFRRMSPLKRAAVGVVCAAVIFVGIACHQRVTELQPDPAIATQLAQQKAEADFYAASNALTTQQVADLEAAVARNPEDLGSRRKLLIWYRDTGKKTLGWNEMVAARRPHIFWLIEHHPDSPLILWNISERAEPVTYAQAKKLWLSILEKPDVSAAVLGNAAYFFEESDKPLAEKLLLRAAAVDPTQKTLPAAPAWVYRAGWSESLGNLYAQILVGSNGDTLGNVVHSVSLTDAHSTYADEIRRKLSETTDPVLLASAGAYLLRNVREAKLDFDHVALGKSYLERAIQIDPHVRAASDLLVWQQQWEHHQRLYEPLRNVPRASRPQTLATLPDSSRLELLPELADEEYMYAEMIDFEKRDAAEASAAWDRSKRYANDALALAQSHKTDPVYGTVLYRANVTLGTNALREGDRESAVRFMRDAAAAPPSEELSNPGMSLEGRLVNYLLKAGERDSVADFLEKTAQSRSKHLRPSEKDRRLKDAAAIRAGRMPMSYQYMVTPH